MSIKTLEEFKADVERTLVDYDLPWLEWQILDRPETAEPRDRAVLKIVLLIKGESRSRRWSIVVEEEQRQNDMLFVPMEQLHKGVANLILERGRMTGKMVR